MNKQDLNKILDALKKSAKVRRHWKRDADGNRTPAQKRAALRAANRLGR